MIWLCIPYGLTALVAWRMIAGHLAWRYFEADKVRYPHLTANSKRPDGDNWFGALCLGLILGFLWPLAVIWARWPLTIGAERRNLEAAKKRELEERIAQLEQEVLQ